jgi:hypothetical protein
VCPIWCCTQLASALVTSDSMLSPHSAMRTQGQLTLSTASSLPLPAWPPELEAVHVLESALDCRQRSKYHTTLSSAAAAAAAAAAVAAAAAAMVEAAAAAPGAEEAEVHQLESHRHCCKVTSSTQWEHRSMQHSGSKLPPPPRPRSRLGQQLTHARPRRCCRCRHPVHQGGDGGGGG